MTGQSLLLVQVSGYLVLARLVMQRLKGLLREMLFAALNLGGVYLIFFAGGNGLHSLTFLLYLALAALQYGMLRLFAGNDGWKAWLAFFTPIAALLVVRYVLPLSRIGGLPPVFFEFVGISYFAFRSSYLVLEVRNGVVKPPGVFDYFGFCFFLPTIAVGPINPYHNYRQAFAPDLRAIPRGRALLRILVGFVKYRFLGSVFFQLTYSNLFFDHHYHPWVDLLIAAVSFYVFLYCNFSGFCDMMIGASGLIGIPVAENFRDPFSARNVKDFWNRWHITLSLYMRDAVFSPLSKSLAGRLGPANVNHAIALSVLVVFLLVGIWHGVGWNYAAFGAAQAFGIIAAHYYTIGLKRWLGRDGFKAYNSNPWVHAAMVGLTFLYLSASFFFFANTFPQMKEMFASIR